MTARPAVAALRAEWERDVRPQYDLRRLPDAVTVAFVERLLAALEAPPEPKLEDRRLTPERRARQQAALDTAVICPRCSAVAMFKCPKCGEEFYNHTQSLASSGEHNGLVRGEAGPPPPALEARIGCLGSVNIRHGVAYSYCPECGTEEGPPASRVANPSSELHIYSWRGAVPPWEEPPQ